jgi:hypothetical protein
VALRSSSSSASRSAATAAARSVRLQCGMSSRSAPRSSTDADADLTAHAAGSAGAPPARGADSTTIAFSQRSSSTRRTIALAVVLNPVGRFAVAKNSACSAPTAASARATTESCSTGSRSTPSARETSARNRAASARQASIAPARSGSRAGAGQSSPTASSAAPDARPQPARRSGIEEVGPASETGRMNASSNDVVAEASTELTTPANSTTKPTSTMETAPSASEFDASVPRHTNAPQTRESAACACRRPRMGPLKSTSRSIAKEPKAAKVATIGLPITRSPSANIAGITIAVRPARRSARRPGSCARSHAMACACGCEAGISAIVMAAECRSGAWRAGRQAPASSRARRSLITTGSSRLPAVAAMHVGQAPQHPVTDDAATQRERIGTMATSRERIMQSRIARGGGRFKPPVAGSARAAQGRCTISSLIPSGSWKKTA